MGTGAVTDIIAFLHNVAEDEPLEITAYLFGSRGVVIIARIVMPIWSSCHRMSRTHLDISRSNAV